MRMLVIHRRNKNEGGEKKKKKNKMPSSEAKGRYPLPLDYYNLDRVVLSLLVRHIGTTSIQLKLQSDTKTQRQNLRQLYHRFHHHIIKFD